AGSLGCGFESGCAGNRPAKPRVDGLRSVRTRSCQTHCQGDRGGFDAIVDFAGNDKSMGFAVSTVARGGKIVVSGLMGGNFSLPMVQWIYKRMTIEGFMTGTLAEARELMALARAGKIKPTPMKEEPMREAQK